MKKILLVITCLVISANAFTSENSDKAKKVILDFFSENSHILWLGSPDTKYFEMSQETVILKSLTCNDYTDQVAFCVLVSTKDTQDKCGVQGVFFYIDPSSKRIVEFKLFSLDQNKKNDKN